MSGPILATALMLVLAAIFAASTAHKLRVLRDGSASDHPLIRANPLASKAPVAILAASSALELLALGLLLVVPAAGLAILLVLLCVYTLSLRWLEEGEDCDCFGSLAPESDAKSAFRRNLVLAAVTAGTLALVVSGTGPAPVSATTVALAMLLLSPVLGQVALLTLIRSREEEAIDDAAGP